ncbi:hypothetical protein TBLA_0B04240 [Henningerozyma blattae CBS 6284]|uniref:Uncharacterized protein n=1 Tax=Henningerozyma blattae (strain ATCC 34711 / CBS 6284 / DSM 70876 / NBRC 10599 / NRRL Y-10934 / UCD 77-7) TaxID=1071380 RepID=I2GYR0_HENB6|nr:hypothetical protein TBLA_0B04240 [Tetrapisispora blattae CBS 6284]CCH59262.1 hypothetical protein TBLA_0B04240 [Tetrapisispora blattae CBS 6284]
MSTTTKSSSTRVQDRSSKVPNKNDRVGITRIRFQSALKSPDTTKRDQKIVVLQGQIKKIDIELEKIKSELNDVSKGTNQSQTMKSLQDRRKAIVKEQNDLKSNRLQIDKQMELVNQSIKKKNNEINTKLESNNKLKSKGKMKTVEDIELRINESEKKIGSGNLTLLDEKLEIKHLQQLNKLKKDLIALKPIQKSIETDSKKLIELKKNLSHQIKLSKDLSTEFKEINENLNEISQNIKLQNDKRVIYVAKRSLLFNKKDSIRKQISLIRKDFNNEFKSYKQKLQQEKLNFEEDNKMRRLIEAKDIAMEKLNARLNEAKKLAFSDEIYSIENILLALDPTFEKPKRHLFNDQSKFSEINHFQGNNSINSKDLELLENSRQNDISWSNTPPTRSKKVLKRFNKTIAEDENFNKTTNNNNNNSSSSSKFLLEPSLIALLAELDIVVPLNSEQVNKTIEELKSKRQFYLSRQDEQTEKNIKYVTDQIEKVMNEYYKNEKIIKERLALKRKSESKSNTIKEKMKDSGDAKVQDLNPLQTNDIRQEVSSKKGKKASKNSITSKNNEASKQILGVSTPSEVEIVIENDDFKINESNEVEKTENQSASNNVKISNTEVQQIDDKNLEYPQNIIELKQNESDTITNSDESEEKEFELKITKEYTEDNLEKEKLTEIESEEAQEVKESKNIIEDKEIKEQSELDSTNLDACEETKEVQELKESESNESVPKEIETSEVNEKQNQTELINLEEVSGEIERKSVETVEDYQKTKSKKVDEQKDTQVTSLNLESEEIKESGSSTIEKTDNTVTKDELALQNSSTYEDEEIIEEFVIDEENNSKILNRKGVSQLPIEA